METLAVTMPLLPGGRDFVALRGPIVLACAVVGVLLAPFFSRQRSNSISGSIALIGFIVALLATLFTPLPEGPAFNGMMVLDPSATFWEQVLLVFMIGLTLMWFASTRRALRPGDGAEFFTLLLVSTVGMTLMGRTTNLLMLVLATELASMPSYLLAGFRKTRRAASEASLKFVLFGAVCTAVMIYGVSLIYGTHGTLSVDAVAHDLRSGPLPITTLIGLLALFVGLLFKISAVPLHFWAPDVLEGSSADVAAFLSVASKGAGLVLLARVATMLAEGNAPLAGAIATVIGAVSILSMIVGNLGALQQTSLKRLLAYSSIAHAGYMMGAAALVLPERMDSAMTVLGVYLAIYLFMQLGAFAVVGEVETRRGSDRIESFKGLSTLAPMSALALAAAMLSMIGLPPLGGFWAKLKVMIVLATQGGWWWILVLSIGINSIISIGFYARVLRAMYLEKPDVADGARFSPATGALGAACAIGLLATFIFLAPLESTSLRMARQYRTPAPIVQTP